MCGPPREKRVYSRDPPQSPNCPQERPQLTQSPCLNFTNRKPCVNNAEETQRRADLQAPSEQLRRWPTRGKKKVIMKPFVYLFIKLICAKRESRHEQNTLMCLYLCDSIAEYQWMSWSENRKARFCNLHLPLRRPQLQYGFQAGVHSPGDRRNTTARLVTMDV